MRNRAFSIAAACLIMLFTQPVLAEPLQWNAPLTLVQAIERVQSASFDVRMAQADADAATARTTSADAQLLPQIGVSGTATNGGITQLGMPLAQQTYLSATASVPLFVPSITATASGATHAAEAARFTIAAQRNDAMLLATQAYERALLAQAVVASRTVTVRYEQRHVDDVLIRVRTGDFARYQLVESQAALSRAQQWLEDAAAEGDESIADLEVALDFAIVPGLQLADTLSPLHVNGDVTQFTQDAFLQRPEVVIAQAQLRAAKSRVTAARAQFFPTIAATAQTYNGRSMPSLGSTGYQIGVTATLPIIDGGSRPANVHEADAGVVHAQIALEEAQLSAQRDVTNAWREYEAAQHNLDTTRAQAVSAAEELRIATLRERSGKGITLETLSALSDDAAARENVLRAVARLNVAIATVHHAAGDAAIE